MMVFNKNGVLVEKQSARSISEALVELVNKKKSKLMQTGLNNYNQADTAYRESIYLQKIENILLQRV